MKKDFHYLPLVVEENRLLVGLYSSFYVPAQAGKFKGKIV